MREILNNPEVIAAATSCLVALFGLITAALMFARQRLSVKKANAYADGKLADLEKENAKLKTVVIQAYLDNINKEKTDEKTV